MTISLDTTVLIDLANREAAVQRAYDRATQHGIVPWTCVFAAHEFLFGARISARPDQQTAASHRILDQMAIADWTLADAEGTVDVRVALRRIGKEIGSIDCLIAGQALARGWTLVTSNVREFHRVEGLNVIDWRTQPD